MKNYLRLVKLMFSSNRILLAGSFALVLVSLGLESMIPIIMNESIDRIEREQRISILIGCILIFSIAYLLLSFLVAFKSRLFDQIGKHILWTTRKRIYESMWYSDYSKYVKDAKEKLKYVLTTETYIVYAITTYYTFGAFSRILTILVFLGIAVWLNPTIAGILFLAMIGTSALSAVCGKMIFNASEKYDQAKEEDVIINHENVDMVELVRTNGLEDYYINRNKEKLDVFIEKSSKANSLEIFCDYLDSAVHNVIYLLIAGVLIFSKVSNGQIVTALFITNYLLQQSQGLQRQIQAVMKNIPMFGKVVEAMDTPIPEGNELAEIQNIEFEQVTLVYDDRTVFEGLSFQIQKGDNIWIVGENGSGKSSIAKMLMGLEKQKSGQIRINGKELQEYDVKKFYEKICYVSQDEMILNETVEIYLQEITHKKLSMKELDSLKDYICFNPEIKRIEQNGDTLSGGEKKKLLLMKSMLREEASVLILDEIDAGLDKKAKAILQEVERKFINDPNKTVIKISHTGNEEDGGYHKLYLG